MLDERVKLSLVAALLLVSFPRDSDPDSVGQVADALRPDELVQLGIDSNIGGPHEFGDPLPDLVECLGRLSFELGAVRQFVDVDGGINSGLGESCPCFLLGHLINI